MFMYITMSTMAYFLEFATTSNPSTMVTVNDNIVTENDSIINSTSSRDIFVDTKRTNNYNKSFATKNSLLFQSTTSTTASSNSSPSFITSALISQSSTFPSSSSSSSSLSMSSSTSTSSTAATTTQVFHLYNLQNEAKKNLQPSQQTFQNYLLSQQDQSNLNFFLPSSTASSSSSSSSSSLASLPTAVATTTTTTLPPSVAISNLTNLLDQQLNHSTNDTNILISFIAPTFLPTTTTRTTSGASFITLLSTSSSSSSTNDLINFENIQNLSSSSHIVTSDYLNLTWSRGCAVSVFLLLILITVIGNTLVILSVLTTRRLRTVTNCFVMNLAITDWLVGIFVMPPSVILYIVGSWKFGWILCDVWISLDVLLCTASILSLCAISLDRYLAVIQPLTYSKKRRSKRLAMFMIFIVWIVAFSITCPPFLGWYEPGRRQNEMIECRYNQNKGYVVFSAMGSFFIPMTVMLYVYLNIGFVLTSRRQRINLTEASEKSPENDADCENFLTETENIIHQCSPKIPHAFQHKYKSKAFENDLLSSHYQNSSGNNRRNGSNGGGGVGGDSSSSGGGGSGGGGGGGANINNSTTLYELVEISRSSSSMIRCSTISCKYATPTIGPKSLNILSGRDRISNGGNSSGSDGNFHDEQIPMETIHFSQSHTSFAESNLSALKYKVHNNNNHHNHNHHHHHHLQQHHHLHNTQHQQQSTTTATVTATSNKIGKSHRAPPMRISTQKRDTKTAKTLTIVMGGFIACWLPFFTYYILIPFLPRDSINENLMSFLTWVGWVNCAINPFIYAFYNPDFRTAFWRLTFRRMCKKPTNNFKIFKS